MSETRPKSERVKILLIPVLGSVLFSVLPGGEDDAAAGPAELVTASAAPPASHDHAAEPVSAPVRAAWPHEPLATITAHNPFELKDPRVLLDRAFAEAGITGPAYFLS